MTGIEMSVDIVWPLCLSLTGLEIEVYFAEELWVSIFGEDCLGFCPLEVHLEDGKGGR